MRTCRPDLPVPSPATAPSRRRALLTLGAILAVPLTGCSKVLPRPAAPDISVAGVALESMSAEGLAVIVLLSTRNPNGIDVPLTDLNFDLALLGQHVGRGLSAEPTFTLPANGEREVPIRLTVARADLRGLAGKLLSTPASDASWEVRGSVKWGKVPVALPFEKRGTLDLRKLAGALLR
jgi:LEA14-like dessication related protein